MLDHQIPVNKVTLSFQRPSWARGPPSDCGGRFKPGWNGLARTPPLGWRSWSAFGNRISQNMMMEAAEALVAKKVLNGTILKT